MPPRPPTRRELGALAVTLGLFGAAFGTSAVATGLDPVVVVAMSSLVMGGAGQFACLGVIAAGGPAATGVATGLLVNARYLALGLAAAPMLPARARQLAVRVHVLGEHAVAFGLAAGGHGATARRAFDAAGATVGGARIAGTAVGAVARAAVPDPTVLGLDAALPAGLAALLGGALRRGPTRRAVAAGIAVALLLVPLTQAGVPALGAAAVGLLLGLRHGARR